MKKCSGKRREEAPMATAVCRRSEFFERMRLVEETALALFVFGVVMVILAGSLPPRSLNGSFSPAPAYLGDSFSEDLALYEVRDDSFAAGPYLRSGLLED